MTQRLLSTIIPLLCAGLAFANPADEFERKIRPVLVEHCYKCHSAEHKAEKGGLRLDSRERMLQGGESGPAVVPGKPAESLLLKAIRHADDTPKMPPKGDRLAATVVTDFEAWIAAGAHVPAAAKTTAAIDWAAARKHWAFQPVGSQGSGVRSQESGNSIDDLLLEKLTAAGLSFSPPADRRTLLRRVYFDLVGLPPTWDETEAFVRDESPDAFERVVDRLLASPRYGERWGRHWLDVARFADTKDGVLMYGDDRIRPYAYTYRDYVIRAFNDDLPFDRFVHEQLAADQMPGAEPWRLAAMGFLTLGRIFDNNLPDILDDRVDTVSRALLGLTVSCARCHDHKYDPVPMADYYSLYGVFANSEVPHVLPPLEPGRKGPDEFEKKYTAKAREIQDVLDRQYALQSESARSRVADYLVHVATTKPDPLETATYFLSLAPEDLRPPIVARWRHLLAQRATPNDAVFGPWHDLFALSDGQFADQAPLVVLRLRVQPAPRANPLVLDALSNVPLKSRRTWPALTAPSSSACTTSRRSRSRPPTPSPCSPSSPARTARATSRRATPGATCPGATRTPSAASSPSSTAWPSRSRTPRRGRWPWWTVRNCPIRGSSFAATRPGRGKPYLDSSSLSWPARTASRSRTAPVDSTWRGRSPTRPTRSPRASS
jgi:hypothetical protein